MLESEQEELLFSVVEATWNITRKDRQKFYVSQTTIGDILHHPGLPGGSIEIYYGDIEILARSNLLLLSYGSSGTPLFDVTHQGFQYYKQLKQNRNEPIQTIEKSVVEYLRSEDFQSKYSVPYKKWLDAENLLWVADSEGKLTTIGHLCREAVQEFTTILVEKYKPDKVSNNVANTILRIRSVINMNSELNKTKKRLLNALIEYWQALNDLVQRQEHGAQKEGEKLIWEDGRLIVFQTIMAMFEIDRALIYSTKVDLINKIVSYSPSLSNSDISR